VGRSETDANAVTASRLVSTPKQQLANGCYPEAEIAARGTTILAGRIARR